MPVCALLALTSSIIWVSLTEIAPLLKRGLTPFKADVTSGEVKMKTDRLTGPPKENNYKWQIIVENAYKSSAFHHFRPKSNYVLISHFGQ